MTLSLHRTAEVHHAAFRSALLSTAGSALVVALVSGCGQGTLERTDVRSNEAPDAPVPEGSPLPTDAQGVGLAITPSGERYILEKNTGLYRVDAEGSALVFSTQNLTERFVDIEDGIELTDVAAISETQFVVTAENDGFMLDLASGQLWSYFCYLPTVAPDDVVAPAPTPVSVSQSYQLQGIAVKQRTESVGFNSADGSLFAQPLTIRLDTNEVVGSELFMFAASGGEPIRVLTLPDATFVAGGMVAGNDQVLLGQGNNIYVATLDAVPSMVHTLAPGVVITGMARDPSGQLFALDGATLAIVAVPGL